MPSPTELSDWVVEALDGLNAQDVQVLDVTKQTDITDFMVIASGNSSRHILSLVDRLIASAKDSGVEVLGVEGRDHSDWVLVDLGNAVVHLMRKDTRTFYDLERLWSTPVGSLVRM